MRGPNVTYFVLYLSNTIIAVLYYNLLKSSQMSDRKYVDRSYKSNRATKKGLPTGISNFVDRFTKGKSTSKYLMIGFMLLTSVTCKYMWLNCEPVGGEENSIYQLREKLRDIRSDYKKPSDI